VRPSESLAEHPHLGVGAVDVVVGLVEPLDLVGLIRAAGYGITGSPPARAGASCADEVRRMSRAAYADAVSGYAALGAVRAAGGSPRRHGGYFGSLSNFEADQK
jgi:hypothetical protein